MANIAEAAVQNLSTHESLIRELIAEHPHVRRDGFWNALRKLPNASYLQELLRPHGWWRSTVAFIPDAYAIHEDAKEIIVFEMVCRHEISDDKFEKMIDLAFALDEDEWSLTLVRCDLLGRTPYYLLDMHVDRECAAVRGEVVPRWLSLHGKTGAPE